MTQPTESKASEGTSVPGGGPDRWWLTAAIASGACVICGALLCVFPESRIVWGIIAFLLIFGIVLWFNPRFWYRRAAGTMFCGAATLATFPKIDAKLDFGEAAKLGYSSEHSPIETIGFLIVGVILCWFDARRNWLTQSSQPTSPEQIVHVGSQQQVTNHYYSGCTIVLNQPAPPIPSVNNRSGHSDQGPSSADTRELAAGTGFDCDLLQMLIDEIQDARKAIDRSRTAALIGRLDRQFQTAGTSWPGELRIEVLTILAEDEMQQQIRARESGLSVDLTRLKDLQRQLANEHEQSG